MPNYNTVAPYDDNDTMLIKRVNFMLGLIIKQNFIAH